MKVNKRFGRTILIALVVLVAAVGCGRRLSTEEQQQIATLKSQLSTVKNEISAAQTDYAKYEGGLIKVMTAVRLEVLKTNEALLDQRVQAIESGTKLNIVINVSKEDPIRAAQIAAEIESEKAKVSAAKEKAAAYSGGLIQAMALMNVTTAENSLALLEQQYLVAKYGLALPTAVPGK